MCDAILKQLAPNAFYHSPWNGDSIECFSGGASGRFAGKLAGNGTNLQ